MNESQKEGRNSVLRLCVDIEHYGDKYVGFVYAGRFNCLHVTLPYETKIDAIYELTGALTHLKDEADKCLNELFTERYEIDILNAKKEKLEK